MNATTTTATTHTPGPWLAYNADKGRTLKHWRIRGHCVRDDPTFATIDSNGKLSPGYEAANARLMAAAPELLAACAAAFRDLTNSRAITKGYDTGKDCCTPEAQVAIEMLRLALAKATA